MQPEKRSASPLDVPGVKRHRSDTTANGQPDANDVAVADTTCQSIEGGDAAAAGAVEQPPSDNSTAANEQPQPESRDDMIVIRVVFKREPMPGAPSSMLGGPSTVSQSTQYPDWAPFSHKPIYPGEPGYGTYKSRIVFESEPVSSDLRYCNTDYGRTVSALDKFLLWRKKQVDKLHDGALRSAPRIIVLDEGEPCMPLHDLDKYTTTIWRAGATNLGKLLTLGMPNSFVVIRISCPANNQTGRGRFQAYIEALFHLLKEYPHNFSVEVTDETIREVHLPNADHKFFMHFIDCLKVFHETGALPNCEKKPFRYRAKKHRVGQEFKADGTFVDYLEREVQAAVKFLPWISEDYARQFYTKILQDPYHDMGSLEPEQTRQNPTGLMPQEKIIHAASLDRAL